MKSKIAKIIFLALSAIFFFGLETLSRSTFPIPTQLPSSSPDVLSENVDTLPEPTSTPKTASYTVKRVIDGDTLELDNGERVRLIGIDTPELNKNDASGCFGREAYDYLDKLLKGKIIELEKDVSDKDRYGRLLRFVYLNGELINDKLVRDGYARVYTYPPDVKLQDVFKTSEKIAQDENLGLWSECTVTSSQNSTTVVQQVVQKGETVVGGQVSGSYSCDCSKPCTEISTCIEAQYQLNVCGCSKRDGDGDGIACDGAPLNCQN